MKNPIFFRCCFLCLAWLIISFIIPRNVSLSFSKDLNQYNIDENLKILITKVRFLLLGCAAIIYQIYFNNISIKIMIILEIIIFCLTPKLFFKNKLYKNNL
ncbi:MAG: hypothetical protein ACRCW0_08965 [Clostridium sp.]